MTGNNGQVAVDTGLERTEKIEPIQGARFYHAEFKVSTANGQGKEVPGSANIIATDDGEAYLIARELALESIMGDARVIEMSVTDRGDIYQSREIASLTGNLG